MENYLYTFEAFQRYWQLLTDRGVLQISRWYYPGSDRESFRVFTMAFEVLAAQGIREPGQHLAVIGDVRGDTAPFADVIWSKRPLTRAHADALVRFAQANALGIVYLPPRLSPSTSMSNEYYRFAGAHANGHSREFYAAYRVSRRGCQEARSVRARSVTGPTIRAPNRRHLVRREGELVAAVVRGGTRVTELGHRASRSHHHHTYPPPRGVTRPLSKANTTAAARSRSCSLANTWLTWVLTVPSPRTSSSADPCALDRRWSSQSLNAIRAA